MNLSKRLLLRRVAQVGLPGLFLLLFSGTPTSGQEVPAPTPQSPPEDAQARFALIQKLNALDSSGGHAWHIRLAYDHFDSDGDNDSSGTYEEWFVGPSKYKRVYSSEDFNRTEIATERGLFVTGSQKWPRKIDWQVPQEVVNPTFWAANEPYPTKLEIINWPVGNLVLPCVIVRPTDRKISDNGLRKYCTNPEDAALRYSRGEGWDQIVYNTMSFFQGRFVPQTVKVTHGKDPYLEIRVVTLEDLPHTDESVFGPAKEATLQTEPIEVVSNVLIVTKSPSYEWLRGEKGRAVVELVIGKDGHVKAVKGLEGPSNLKHLAAESARQMQFRPFIVRGEPVEVKTQWGFSK